MNHVRSVSTLLVALCLTHVAVATTVINEPFSSPPLNPLLQDANSGFTISGASIHRTSNTGSSGTYYIRTNEADFINENFDYWLSFTVPNVGGTNIDFFGIGQGVPLPGFWEPENYVGLRIQSAETNGNIDLALNGDQNLNNNAGVQQQAIGVINASNTNNLMRAELEKIGNQVRFFVDLNYNGSVFNPTVNLTLPDVATSAPFLNSSNTSLFFGTSIPQNQFTNMLVNTLSVPEPSTLVMMGLGIAFLAVVLRPKLREERLERTLRRDGSTSYSLSR